MKTNMVRNFAYLVILTLLLQTLPTLANQNPIEIQPITNSIEPQKASLDSKILPGQIFPRDVSAIKLFNEYSLTGQELVDEIKYPDNSSRMPTEERTYIRPTSEQLAKTQAMVDSFDCSTVTDVPQIECEALVALYNSTNGAGWTYSTNWLVTKTVDDWYGVTVYFGHVIYLYLSSNQLTGSIPPDLGNLSNLYILRLDANQLIGSIPHELGDLIQLNDLELNNNQLSGSIPPELGNLSILQGLWLNDNQLTGSIPLSFINLTRLVGFYFINTNICEPTDPAFLAWKATIYGWASTGIFCDPTYDLQQKYLFVPLNWQGTQDEFESIATTQINNFLNQVPLKNCRDQVYVKILNVDTDNFDTFTCSNNPLTDIRNFVKYKTDYDPADWDVVIGLSETSPCPPTAGLSNLVNTIWVTNLSEIITAHELGHIYGLEDQYCSNQAGSVDQRCNDGDYWGDGIIGDPNYLDADLPFDCPPDGSEDSTGANCCNFSLFNNCTIKNYGVCCYGNKNSNGGRSTMSYSNAPGPRGFDDHELSYLSTKSKLQCVGTQMIIEKQTESVLDEISGFVMNINLNVFYDDTVEEESITINQGLSTDVSILDSLSGEYNLTILDESQNEVINQSFDLFYDYSGPMFENVDYSSIALEVQDVSFRFPYSQRMEKLFLFHNGELIFSKDLPKMYFSFLPFTGR